MRKIILISIVIPIITLTAEANSFYEQRNNKTNQVQHVDARHYQNIENQTVKIRNFALDSKKFFYANRAAKNGNQRAQFDIAMMYATGQGVQRNEKMAFNWFHKSARNNNAVAKHYMGLSFLQGRGVKQQIQLARYWFRLASKQGYGQSVSYLEEIERRLNKR